MRTEVNMFLKCIRYANNNGKFMTPDTYEILANGLGITPKELEDVTYILEADLREKIATHPEFDHIRDLLNRRGN